MSSPYRIGSITTGYRPIQDGKQYDKYFPKLQNTLKLYHLFHA